MGVNGLWQVLQPCARPTNLATLNRKRLAVDASIWIYQFLKAVRNKEGEGLRSSHVVGFFRRICKLLWFGIRPVFVFDGGAPALKRATLQGRRRRREGRREDAIRTANKLLVVQMQRLAEGEAERRRREKEKGVDGDTGQQRAPPSQHQEGVVEGEVIPAAEDLVYVDEQLMSKAERQKNRGFRKQDAYHLPELDRSMHEMGKPNDPRVMSIDELEEYARQFHRGEDINLYDFSKIDFDGDFFKSLPPADRYNILNAARIRSRLRMGLSKEQLDRMFPDRRAFSRFQVERVRERNRLTQRLMLEMGMVNSTDLTIGGRIASERGREYILVKNEGAEGGWALGVVTREKDKGEVHNPIDVDALYASRSKQNGEEDDEEWEDDGDEFEDVPIEGLNRLPKLKKPQADNHPEDSMFVDQDLPIDDLFDDNKLEEDILQAYEEEDINRAIALSLDNQLGLGGGNLEEQGKDGLPVDHEDAPMPEWEQRAAEAPKPIAKASGRTIAHIVNSRASRVVPHARKPLAVDQGNSNGGKEKDISDSDSDSDDLQAALAAARRKKAAAMSQHISPSQGQQHKIVNPFGGPLPFEKLDWKTSAFAKKPFEQAGRTVGSSNSSHNNIDGLGTAPTSSTKESAVHEPGSDDDDELAGGFERTAPEPDGPQPLPPWLLDDSSDIRESLKKQNEVQAEINEQDRELAIEERHRFQREMRNRVVEIDSSDDDAGDDVEIIELVDDSDEVESDGNAGEVEKPRTSPDPTGRPGPSLPPTVVTARENSGDSERGGSASGRKEVEASRLVPSVPEIEFKDVDTKPQTPKADEPTANEDDSEEEFTDVVFEDVPAAHVAQGESMQENAAEAAQLNDAAQFPADEEFGDFSDSDDEELLAQMAEEAEEHARFASSLHDNATYNKSETEAKVDYEQELRQLRMQQKKDRRDADEVTDVMVTECQALLRFFGIPYVTAPMEAEAQCAEFVRLGLVDGIVTDDSDTFLFGGTRVYKNMFNGNKFVECYLGSDLEKELSLSRENLISLAQLLGSDYTEGLPGVGPVTAVEILSEFPGPDGLVRFKDWWREVQSQPAPARLTASVEPSTFKRKFRRSQATRLFLPPGFPNPAVPEAYLKPEVDSDPQPFQWGVPDLDGLRAFLVETVGWSQERTDEVLVPVIRDMNRREREGTQSNITRFFSGGVGVGAMGKEAFAPSRRQGRGSRRMADAVERLRGNAPSGNAAGTSAEQANDVGEGNFQQSSTRTASGSGGRKRRKKAGDTAFASIEDDGDGLFVDGDGAEDGEGDQNGVRSNNNTMRKRGRGS